MPVIWKGPTNGLVMQPNSPALTFGDRVKAVDIYKGPQNLCAANMIPRGTFGLGFRAGWVCTQSAVATERGLIGTLTIEWEAGGAGAIAPLPAGGFSLRPQELNPRTERAGCFNGINPETVNICLNIIQGSNTTTNGEPAVTLATLPYLKTFGGHGVPPVTNPPTVPPAPSPSPDQAKQLGLAQKLLSKLQIGEETFYLAGWRYSFEVFSYVQPAINQGGYVLSGNPGGPITNFPAACSWLRLADECEPAGVNGSMFKTTQTYLGQPKYGGTGAWDPDIYPVPS